MRLTFTCFIIGVVGLATAAPISFTFDNDNLGWTRGDFGNGYSNIQTSSGGAATWGAPGQINGIDHSSYAYHFSSNLGGNHGDLFGGTISLDFSYTGTSSEDPFIVLMSSNSFLVLEQLLIPGSAVNNYNFQLDNSTGWYFNSSQYYQGTAAAFATNSEIQSVLNDLQFIGISTDITGGGDQTQTDNVNLNPVPEPATMTLAGLSALALLRKRKKQ